MSKNAVPRSHPLYGASLLAYPTRRNVQLTALNHATTARYEHCIASGGHVYLGSTVRRTPPKGGEEQLMQTCEVCQVPAPGAAWTRSWTMKGPIGEEDVA